MGAGWQELGTVTLGATDESSSLRLSYSGGSVSISNVVWLEQTGSTIYDAMGNVVSQTDGLNNVTIDGYNSLEQSVSTSQGQIVAASGGAAAVYNLPQTPGQSRVYTLYALSSTSLSPCSCTPSDSDSANPPQFSGGFLTATPLGTGNYWYELGTVNLNKNDATPA